MVHERTKAVQTAWQHHVVSAILSVTDGEELVVVAYDTEQPEYVWCTNSVGEGGWVPSEILRVEGARGLVQYSCEHPYDAYQQIAVLERYSVF